MGRRKSYNSAILDSNLVPLLPSWGEFPTVPDSASPSVKRRSSSSTQRFAVVVGEQTVCHALGHGRRSDGCADLVPSSLPDPVTLE